MASNKVEFCLQEKKPPEHNLSVTFVAKFGTVNKRN